MVIWVHHIHSSQDLFKFQKLWVSGGASEWSTGKLRCWVLSAIGLAGGLMFTPEWVTPSKCRNIWKSLKIIENQYLYGVSKNGKSDCGDPELWDYEKASSPEVLYCSYIETIWNSIVPGSHGSWGWVWMVSDALEGLWIVWIVGDVGLGRDRKSILEHPGMPEVHTTPTLPAFNA